MNLSKRMKEAKVCPYLLRNAVIDWYSRCIVGWEIDETLDTRMVIKALEKAFKVATPEIINSDQGSQFASNKYIDFLKENHIKQSMDGKSRWADNIMIERWFRTFKYEEVYLTKYSNIKTAREAISKYIHTYNFERRHSAIEYHTPAEMTTQYNYCHMQLKVVHTSDSLRKMDFFVLTIRPLYLRRGIGYFNG